MYLLACYCVSRGVGILNRGAPLASTPIFPCRFHTLCILFGFNLRRSLDPDGAIYYLYPHKTQYLKGKFIFTPQVLKLSLSLPIVALRSRSRGSHLSLYIVASLYVAPRTHQCVYTRLIHTQMQTCKPWPPEIAPGYFPFKRRLCCAVGITRVTYDSYLF